MEAAMNEEKDIFRRTKVDEEDSIDFPDGTDAETSDWIEIVPHRVRTDLRRPLSAERARSWQLTLQSRGLPCRFKPLARGWQLFVREPDYDSALSELQRYEVENRDWPPVSAIPSAAADAWPTATVLAALALFHNLIRLDLFGLTGAPWIWLRQGAASVAAIRDGQWWRLLTALTLHTDGQHLIGNLLIGGGFAFCLCRRLGNGPAWLLILAGGALGNAGNSLIQPLHHSSVGASTAVFATVGILAALRLPEMKGGGGRRWILPLLSGLALLGLLGTSGEQTDLGAHLCGFLAGLLLGVMAAPRLAHALRNPLLGRLLGLTSLLIVILAWYTALTSH
jgi:rhomboid protease GluP